MQKQLREAQQAASLGADDAAAEVVRVRDQCARDVREADARAQARADAAQVAQRAQLDAQTAALAEERALLDRNRATTETLSTLSSRVEVAALAAVQREERLTARLENELIDRERR